VIVESFGKIGRRGIMKAITKVIFTLFVTLFLAAPPLTAKTTSDPEIKQIMIAGKPMLNALAVPKINLFLSS
jgi:hypothetical protein